MNIAILGATGYGGIQTIRLLSQHPTFSVSYLGGNRSAGKQWNDICPFLEITDNPTIQEIDPDKIPDNCEYAVLSLPNGIASQIVPTLVKRGIRIVDLSADYRFSSLNKWQQVYPSESNNYKRNDYDLCSESVYGLPELNKTAIASAQIVGSPGCFPTASLLPLLPFLKQGLIEFDGIIIDAKSGTSGGGRLAAEHLLLSECSESVSPYKVIGHRHTPEIEEIAGNIVGRSMQIQFTPHLLPMVRGLLSTVYARLRDPGLTGDDCITLLKTYYRRQLSVQILPIGIYPSTKWVKNTNKALISVQVDKRTGRIVLMCAIDNLIKGQAGQGVQNLNIMASLDETAGLPLTTYYP